MLAPVLSVIFHFHDDFWSKEAENDLEKFVIASSWRVSILSQLFGDIHMLIPLGGRKSEGEVQWMAFWQKFWIKIIWNKKVILWLKNFLIFSAKFPSFEFSPFAELSSHHLHSNSKTCESVFLVVRFAFYCGTARTGDSNED